MRVRVRAGARKERERLRGRVEIEGDEGRIGILEKNLSREMRE